VNDACGENWAICPELHGRYQTTHAGMRPMNASDPFRSWWQDAFYSTEEAAMRKRNVRIVKGSLVGVAFLCVSMASCALFGPGVPSELSGTWSSSAGDYYTSYRFTSNHLYYHGESLAFPGEFISDWDSTIVQVWQSKSMLKTDDPMYFVWHISGSTIYLYKTNPGDPEPTLPDSWWTNGSIGKYTLSRE
jgi:hypothetical protein